MSEPVPPTLAPIITNALPQQRRHIVAAAVAGLAAGAALTALGVTIGFSVRTVPAMQPVAAVVPDCVGAVTHPMKLDDASVPVTWASRVISVSSQYGDSSWAASQVLGMPDTYPRGGDIPSAWASKTPDGGPESIEVAFDRPHRITGIRIAETLNPGAISDVSISMLRWATSTLPNDAATQPNWKSVYRASAAPAGVPSFMRAIAMPCTTFPVYSVRVTLDSAAVPGWNELDAIGIQTCDDDSDRSKTNIAE